MKNILEYLEKTAPRFPERPALCDEESSLSFGEFLHLSRVGGSELLRRGLYHEPVVVFMKKCPKTICAFFSVIYAGCYYIPVDIGMPQQRILMILEKLNPRAVLYDESSEELLRELGYSEQMISCEALFAGSEDEAMLAYVRRRALDIDPIYIVFTSGSTGMPKGVTACHRSVIDYAEALCPVIGSDESSVFAMQVPLFVDACLKELLSVIRCGSEVWLMPQNLFMSPLASLEYLNRHKVNTLCWVASALTMISGFGAFEDVKPACIRTVCFGSEIFPVKQLRLWQEACPGARFINLYGPTECTGMSFYYVVDHEFDDHEPVPVGRPFDNTDFLLLTDDDTEAAPGQPGEICIRGTCVTLGYYADPERTSASFTQNPLNKLLPEIIYRTGDLGYLNDRGELVFVSRKDNQIKNMGHRIELGEIEACADRLDGLESSCCLWDSARHKLVLFYMGTAEEKAVRNYMRGELPRHMLPNKILRLDTIPLLANAKIDRIALKKKYEESLKNGRNS